MSKPIYDNVNAPITSKMLTLIATANYISQGAWIPIIAINDDTIWQGTWREDQQDAIAIAESVLVERFRRLFN